MELKELHSEVPISGRMICGSHERVEVELVLF
jgi:hypothetical protein